MQMPINEDYRQAYDGLNLILKYGFDQITITDGKGVFEAVSQSCNNIFGISEENLIGSSAFDLEKMGVFDISITAEVLRKQKNYLLFKTLKLEKNF